MTLVSSSLISRPRHDTPPSSPLGISAPPHQFFTLLVECILEGPFLLILVAVLVLAGDAWPAWKRCVIGVIPCVRVQV